MCFLPLPYQHWAAIGRSENGQLIGMTVHLHCIENFENFENIEMRMAMDGWQ